MTNGQTTHQNSIEGRNSCCSMGCWSRTFERFTRALKAEQVEKIFSLACIEISQCIQKSWQPRPKLGLELSLSSVANPGQNEASSSCVMRQHNRSWASCSERKICTSTTHPSFNKCLHALLDGPERKLALEFYPLHGNLTQFVKEGIPSENKLMLLFGRERGSSGTYITLLKVQQLSHLTTCFWGVRVEELTSESAFLLKTWLFGF